jgi:hypothetical protein
MGETAFGLHSRCSGRKGHPSGEQDGTVAGTEGGEGSSGANAGGRPNLDVSRGQRGQADDVQSRGPDAAGPSSGW